MKLTKVPPLPFSELHIAFGPLALSSNNWSWNTKIPDCFNLWIALEGQAEMRTLGKVHQIQPGMAFVFAPHQTIIAKTVTQQPFRNFACRFMPAGGGADELKEMSLKMMGVPSSDLGRTREQCRSAVQCTDYKDELATQQSASLCFQLLAQVWRDAHTPTRGNPEAAIMRLMDKLREQPSLRLNVTEMAEEARMSVSQFNRRFLALSGESPMSFAIRQRVMHAKHYLQGSSLGINEIADALGYSDIYFFSRQFKRSTGMSPSAYRESPTNHAPA